MLSLLSLTKSGQYLYTLTHSEHNELISMYVSDPTATIPKTVPTQSVLTQRLKGHINRTVVEAVKDLLFPNVTWDQLAQQSEGTWVVSAMCVPKESCRALGHTSAEAALHLLKRGKQQQAATLQSLILWVQTLLVISADLSLVQYLVPSHHSLSMQGRQTQVEL